MSTGSGLQPERTAIAWVRTSMAVLVNGLLLAREGLRSGPRSASFALLLLSAAFLVGYVILAVRRAHAAQNLRAEVRPLPLLEIRLLAALVCAASTTILLAWALESLSRV